MRVLMVRSREWQDTGRAQPLDVGQVYDVPDVVGADLIVAGAAVLAADDRGLRPPETKPLLPPETKRQRSRP